MVMIMTFLMMVGGDYSAMQCQYSDRALHRFAGVLVTKQQIMPVVLCGMFRMLWYVFSVVTSLHLYRTYQQAVFLSFFLN